VLSPAEEAAVILAQWVREAPALCRAKIAAGQAGEAFKGILTTSSCSQEHPKIVVDDPCKRPYVSGVRQRELNDAIADVQGSAEADRRAA
jgi:hypothetical protein